ncbi:MAG TPA: TetR/AcrR family transcriptional regulator [Anaerolineaceae bacterium]|uniref:Transcriptional regulator, TetR family n=1 Tax=Anaerolinea thermophila TaxID=167964 RepID=A0A117LH39_9CHLR|nr:MAG: Transcriptional regulator, TetR family [Anaerolinea thermophila]HAF60895.1 TetR/AcrR family transcriptional regulator [Anaerolineaceae bacterium]
MLENISTEQRIDPRVKRTRALIEHAFNELLEEKGFQSISVQDITERAEINRSTFYAHFVDKYALLETNITQTFRQELEKRTLSACHYSVENLQILIVTVCDFIMQAKTHCKATGSQFEILVEKQVKQEIRDLLEYWLEQSGSTTDPKLAATAASWAIYGLALQWSNDKQHTNAEFFTEQISPQIQAILQLNQ